MGQKLAQKYKLNDPKSTKSANALGASRQNSINSEEEGSDWTWETCSDSDPEGVDSASICTSKTTKTASSVNTVSSQVKSVSPVSPPVAKQPSKTYKIDAHTAKWLNYKVDKPSDSPKEEPKQKDPPVSTERRMSAFTRLSSYQSPFSPQPTKSTTSESNSSSNSQDSPKTLKKYLRSYAGAGSRTLQLSDSDDDVKALNIGLCLFYPFLIFSSAAIESFSSILYLCLCRNPMNDSLFELQDGEKANLQEVMLWSS